MPWASYPTYNAWTTSRLIDMSFRSFLPHLCMQLVQQGRNVFLTGDAGTGKSFLLREFVAWASQQTPPRRVLCTATTGIAAQNINGRTIHSAVKWSPKINLSNDWEIDFESKAVALKRSDILIVDEISMMTPSFLRFLLKCISYFNSRPRVRGDSKSN